MHPHLQTTEKLARCEDVINVLEECHARGFLYKAVGMCNQAEWNLRMCLRAERVERTRKHREAALAQRAKIKEIWAEIDANS